MTRKIHCILWFLSMGNFWGKGPSINDVGPFFRFYDPLVVYHRLWLDKSTSEQKFPQISKLVGVIQKLCWLYLKQVATTYFHWLSEHFGEIKNYVCFAQNKVPLFICLVCWGVPHSPLEENLFMDGS